jgi:hypothetical protein
MMAKTARIRASAVRRTQVLDGTVIGRNMQRYSHQEFIRFLNTIDAVIPAGKLVHVILDNYAAHRIPRYARGSAATSASPSLHADILFLAECG